MTAEKKPKFGYRPDIDGLRAVAVLGVVLFHADLGFPGGYVGVDVFFVISGFLITSLIVKDLERGRFSLREFWARRIRRILPASTAMVVAVSACAFLLLVSSDFERVMRSVLWNQLLLANHHYYSQVGYFAESAELQPLLHTWSLAVEEQFYLVFPLFLALGRRYVPNYLLALTAAVAASSLIVSVILLHIDQAATFFLLPFRAWELLAGAMIALAPEFRLERRVAAFTSMAGITMVILPMCIYTKKTPFPGLAAIVPVLGAAAIIIVGCVESTTVANRVLSCKPFVSVGKLSYSLYLWHWPLFAFASLLLVDQPITLRLALVALSFVLAIPSYYLIEQPFRRSPYLLTPRRALGFAGTVAAPIIALAAATLAMNGFPSLMDERLRTLSEDIKNTATRYKRLHGKPVAIGAPRAPHDAPDFVLWGDSHAMASANAFDDAARRIGVSGNVYAESALAPVPGVGHRAPSTARLSPEAATRLNNDIKREILRDGAGTVILIGRWSVYSSGFSDIETTAGSNRYAPIAAERLGEPADPARSSELLREKLADLITELTGNGIGVWVIAQIPEAASRTPARDLLSLRRFGRINQILGNRASVMTYEEHQRRQARANYVVGVASEIAGATLVDVSPQCFDADGVLVVASGRSFYRDADHLTEYGSERFFSDAASQILSGIAGEGKR